MSPIIPAKLMQPRFLMIVAAIAAILIFSNINLGDSVAAITGGSGDYVERPVFKYVKCEPVGGFQYSQNYPVTGSWVTPPASTDQYKVRLTAGNLPFVSADGQFNYYVCDSRSISESNCEVYDKLAKGIKEGQIYELPETIQANQYVWVEWQSYYLFKRRAETGATYKVGFTPYGLREYNVLGGSSAPLNTGACVLNNPAYSSASQIKSENVQSVQVPTSNYAKTQNDFDINEVRWYLSGYVASSADGVDLGDGTWCRDVGSSGKIYSINTVKTGSGTYKIADPNYNSFIRNVDCCPNDIQGDQRCTENFEWEKTGGTECSAFNSCGAVDWQPNGEGELIRFACVEGTCQEQTKSVECSSSYDCKQTLEVCDKNTWTCVDADVNLDGRAFVPTPDSLTACQDAGGKWIKETTEDQSILNFIGIGEPKVVVEEYCDLSKPNYFGWIITFIIVAAVAFLVIKFFPAIRRFARI